MMNLICDKCETRYALLSVNNTLMQLGRGDYDVTWFACPACGTVHVVAIKDLKYYDLKAALDKAKEKLRTAIESGDTEKAKKFQFVVEHKAYLVSRHLENTMSKFHGTFTALSFEDKQPELVYLP